MTRDELVERIARAICGRRCLRAEVFADPCIEAKTSRNAPCRMTDAQIWLSTNSSAARDVLAAIHDRGLRVVPAEPTEEMISAARQLNHPRDRDVYLTMLSASPISKEA